MTVARAVGLRTEGQLRYRDDTLFIPRFDRRIRDGKVLRLHQESAASLAGIVGFEATPSQFDLLQALRAVVSDKTAETIEFLKRAISRLTQAQFAEHRGVSLKTIKEIESGKGNPTILTLNRIGQFFGLEVAFVRTETLREKKIAPASARAISPQ